jgi:serine protease
LISIMVIQLYGWKNFVIGINIGITGFLLVHAIIHPKVWGIPSTDITRLFLLINAFLNLKLAHAISTKHKSKYSVKN